MRFLAFAILSFVLLATPATAQSYGRSFGASTCQQSFSCDMSVDTMAALYPLANTCISQNFGYPPGDGFFDEGMGLDANNCLAAKPNVLPQGVGGRLTPLCCVVTSDQQNVCKLRCNLMSVK